MANAQGGMTVIAAVRSGEPLLVESFAQWREAARQLLEHDVAPHAVQWVVRQDEGGDLFSGVASPAQGGEPAQSHAGRSRDAKAAAQMAAPDLFSDPEPPASGDAKRVAPSQLGGASGQTSTQAVASDAGMPAEVPGGVAHGSAPQLAPDASHHFDNAPPADDAQSGVPPLPPATGRNPSGVRISRTLMEMLQSAACFRAADRWSFLYRIVWRWQQGEHEVVSPADEDGARLNAMVKAVRREEHDMHAYVRFRERPESAGPPRFVAWFEPSHDVLPQVSRHFAARMGRITWMLATPEETVFWDGSALHSVPSTIRSPADIDDAGEALWLTYYRSIFNPARLNEKVFKGHIPGRFWKNLPEGVLVPEMISSAAAGARSTGQTRTVGERDGYVIPVTPEKAQPQREQAGSLDQCRRCDLWQHATQAVGAEGPPSARIMLVGEQPGDQEDLAGKPFIGPAGALLDSVMKKAALDRAKVYLTNAVKHFKWEPRGKRRLHKTPAQHEVAACRHWLEHELEQVAPAVVVALGATALKAVLGDGRASLRDALGKPFQHEGRWVVAVYHPSYVLRVPDQAGKDEAVRVMVHGFQEALRLADGKE